MSNSSLFKLETKVALENPTSEQPSVRISADNETREKIWGMVTDRQLNPFAASYTGGSPTAITLTPYPGYSLELIQSMAYSFAALAQVEYLRELFVRPIYELVDLTPSGFVINKETVVRIQRSYATKTAVRELQRKLDRLSGLNTGAIIDWYNEAIEAYRRADPYHRAQIESAMAELKGFRDSVIEMKRAKADHEKKLREEIASFAKDFQDETSGETVYRIYEEIMDEMDAEHERLREEVNSFKSFDRIQFEIMDQIRRATPPAPATAKK